MRLALKRITAGQNETDIEIIKIVLD